MNARGEGTMKIVFLTAAAVFWSTSYAYAGAWTAPRGAMYHKLSINYYQAEDLFDSNGHRAGQDADGRFTDLNATYYGEYGIIDRLTASTTFAYKALEFTDDSSGGTDPSTSGIGDIEAALKYRIHGGKAGIFSALTMVKIPEAYDEDDSLPLGSGQYDIEGRLLYGRSLYPAVPGYCGVEIAYRHRVDDPADEVKYLLEFGADIYRNLYGRVKLDGTWGMNNGASQESSGDSDDCSSCEKDGTGRSASAGTSESSTGDSGTGTGYATQYTTNEYDIGKLDLALGYKITPRWAVETGTVLDIYGTNITAGLSFFLAVVFQTR
jgi:hypothetical protein